MLEIRALTSGYGRTRILDRVELIVHEHQLVVLTGPNGHGKTTLLRTVSGLIPAWEGEISFLGERIDRLGARRIVSRGLLHVPQGDLLFQDMTVEQNLLMGAFVKDAWRRRSERLERVYQLFPRLEERRHQQSRTLSGGERRMVSLGRGLMGPARLLMIDEPALGLAPVLVQELYATLGEIAQSEATVLLVEETLGHAQRLADRVYVMENGRVVLEGTVPEVTGHEAMRSAYLGGEVE
jgi:branched-chain amino acid transport system ATP-binding protein